MKKSEKGITLIALVITIIVLLILASVSIAMLTGENGILTRAQKAKNETQKAQANEENLLGDYEDAIYKATGEVKQVDDKNPGVLEGSGTQEEPFVINSIEDLVVFADNVTKGTNTYQGQYVELGLSLDFNSDKSYVNPNREDYTQYGYNGKLKEVLNTSGFIPIGLQEGTIAEIEEKSFDGDFDGKGFTIYNLKINKSKRLESGFFFAGLFANNMGNIKQISMANSIIDLNVNTEVGGRLCAGILAARNRGTIEKCSTSGILNGSNSSYAFNIAGIVGANCGTIRECYNVANVNGKFSTRENYVAGIAGSNETGGVIENVYNIGNIDAKVFGQQNEELDNICIIGGIVGRNVGNIIENAYSTGVISETNNQFTKANIGGIIGLNDTELKNGYYLENVINASKINTNISKDGEVKTSDQMKTQEFLDLLNKDNSGKWKFVSGKNNGYPVLYWE